MSTSSVPASKASPKSKATPKPKAAKAPAAPSAAVMPTYARQNLVFESGAGAWLVSTTGERYLDFGSGVAVNLLGHAHPKLVAAITEQSQKLWHCSNLYRVAGQERLAERLCEATFADKVFFCNSGAEACEGAIKVARRYHFAGGQPGEVAHRHLQGRLPRPHAGDHRCRRQREIPGRLRHAGARLRYRSVRRPGCGAGGHQPGDGRDHGRAGAGRGRRARCRHGVSQGAARAVRSARAAAGAGRSAMRHGPHRQAVRA